MSIENYTDNEEKLGGMNKTNPFSVPDGYFENLPAQIQTRIVSAKRRNIAEILYAYILKPQYSVTFIVLFTVAFFAVKKYNNSGIFSKADYEMLEQSAYIHEIDEDLIIESIPEKKQEQKIQNEIENYLIDNHIDLSQITDNESL